MPPSPSELPIAHICAPRFPHDPIDIIANEPGLKRPGRMTRNRRAALDGFQ
ncbi:MAG: hypothetical protein QOH66_3082 [Actinomycetota bacterium]|nr:hypothetical protein [Actinomycetota bacterium]